ncbi:MAG: tRNA (adenosine(37)-N6)-dimethylallyltransferase MiaA [Clostridia bacterium]|nr:tRNA (adenosine(37)-N6)-dimethylallyltransferase MiaA [Clostridia bacterium]
MDRVEQTGKIKSIAIVGSTASGKSALALAAAKRFDGEILSVDSMQVYRTMDIGTAKPTAAEQAEVRHHLIDICDPKSPFSAADFAPQALACAKEVASRGKLPIFCGGTGLYLDSLMRGDAPSETAADENVRAELRAFAETNGVHALHARLAEVDAESAEQIHENNVKRVIRALEVYLVSGKPKSAWDRESRLVPKAIEPTVIGLAYHDRELLYARIDARVDAMLAAGLLEETKRLDADGVFAANGTAAAAIGYKELLPAIRGEISPEEAAETLKRATRRYAKRQMTWFSAKDYVLPLWCDTASGEMRPFDDIFAELCRMVGERGI